jgi:hypothetical protein
MRRIPVFAFALIPAFVFAPVLAVTMGPSPALDRQDAAPPAQPPPQQQQQQGTSPDAGSDPGWPPGLGSWEGPPPPSGGDPDEAENRGLTSPEVERSQMPEPTQQGTRSPEETNTTRAEDAALYEALAQVRRAPPGLDGRPVTRPNPLGSEPETEMEPHPAGNPESLFPEGYVE